MAMPSVPVSLVSTSSGRLGTCGTVEPLEDEELLDAFRLTEGDASVLVRTLRAPEEAADLKPPVTCGQRVRVFGRVLTVDGTTVLVADAVRPFMAG
jgi:hypothetical protein